MGCGLSTLKGEAPPDLTSEPNKSRHAIPHHFHLNDTSANPGTGTGIDSSAEAPAPAPDLYDSSAPRADPAEVAEPASSAEGKKQGLYERYQASKMGRNVRYTDEELKKNIGMTREEMREWAERKQGVGKNQLSGRAIGGTHMSGEMGVGAEGRKGVGLV